MQQLTPKEMLEDLSCCYCHESSLLYRADPANEIVCESCGRIYPCDHSIPDFLLHEELDDTNRNEIAGNQVDLTDGSAVSRMASKDDWDSAYTRTLMQAIRIVAEFMRSYPDETVVVSLGSGTAFELKKLCELRSFRRVYSSDISRTTTRIAPVTLSAIDGQLGLFVAEFSRSPVSKRKGVLGLVFQALHHTADVHATLQNLLEDSFLDLVIVEPTTNWFVELLALFGIAKRTEYSGLKPSWLRLRRVRAIARQCGYRIRVRTWWEFPPQLIWAFRRTPRLSRSIQAILEGFSWLSGWFHFGSMSAIHFTKW